jgi:NAD(P)-dependent dehydrogenase (short-subunit alcohol dehydrogenase family)
MSLKKKKNIILTGGLGFLGSYFSKHLLKKNYRVFSIDKKLQKTKIKNRNFYFFETDITDERQVKNLNNELKSIQITGLVNNAAIDAIPKKNLKSNLQYPDLKIWRKEIDVSILGSFLMIKYFGKKMQSKKEGTIINIGSDLSLIAPNQKIYEESYPNYYKPPTYSVVKHGLLGLTKYYASLYGKNKVTVNMISPGPIKNKQNIKLINKIKNITPMGRLSRREDIFGILEFLLSKDAKFITGQNIFVDGGRTII